MDVQVWRSLDEVDGSSPLVPCVVSVGTFDGVHRGHRVVLRTARDEADRRGLPLTVLTFDPHPMSVIRPGHQPPAIATLRHRIELLADAGADAVLVLPFTTETAAMAAMDFVETVLVRATQARSVVVGEDFRFGHRAAGDVGMLERVGRDWGFDLVAVPPVGNDGIRWSSTEVRRRVSQGDVRGAREVLGHVFEMEGPVIGGDRRGRDLGFPTANTAVPNGMLVPADGVYAGRLRTLDPGGPPLPAAVSVGTNPTFGGVTRRVEAFVLDSDVTAGVDLDLYDRMVAISFVERLRDQVRFDEVDDLVAQMYDDVSRTWAVLRDDESGEA